MEFSTSRNRAYFASKYKHILNSPILPQKCLSSFSDIQAASSYLHILPSFLLALVAAIPNHMLRYTALGLLFVLAVLCTVHLRSPSTQLCHLTHLIDQTEDLIRRAMVQHPRDHFGLTEEMGRLLEVNKTISLLKCRNLDSKGEQFTWIKYRELCEDIAACAKRVRKIRTAVLRIVEVGHQRKLEGDIKEIQFILTAGSTHAASPVAESITASQYPPYRIIPLLPRRD
ncbi:hypothetical protein B0H13DRAFT_2499757 [Mycena leptocephala]|nr:hypothetical protein B0H13DRAFT_2499757 [Mycena leptocephala]